MKRKSMGNLATHTHRQQQKKTNHHIDHRQASNKKKSVQGSSKTTKTQTHARHTEWGPSKKKSKQERQRESKKQRRWMLAQQVAQIEYLTRFVPQQTNINQANTRPLPSMHSCSCSSSHAGRTKERKKGTPIDKTNTQTREGWAATNTDDEWRWWWFDQEERDDRALDPIDGAQQIIDSASQISSVGH